jgi:excisionase family DNA binding protein
MRYSPRQRLPDSRDSGEKPTRDMADSRMFSKDSAEQDADPATSGLLTKPEVAVKLRRSRRTVEVWMREGKLPYLKIGKTVLFRWRDVLEKLNAFRVN